MRLKKTREARFHRSIAFFSQLSIRRQPSKRSCGPINWQAFLALFRVFLPFHSAAGPIYNIPICTDPSSTVTCCYNIGDCILYSHPPLR
ncbi:uncharacterized protein DFL_001794 [Arthrobotrys flagrans]|uniref:Uncharacterized protein n=1 Tax=Arthrobotrys flagrans TaxID=97331 RepID=A0A437A9J5_ARTFL|nr:hypothetical protein DFL_001794 [Arthrobotrys flagrans]